MSEPSRKYRRLLRNMEHAVVEASKVAVEPLAPIAVCADLCIQIMAKVAVDGGEMKFIAMIELFQRRIEQNVDKEINRRKAEAAAKH